MKHIKRCATKLTTANDLRVKFLTKLNISYVLMQQGSAQLNIISMAQPPLCDAFDLLSVRTTF